MLVAALLLAPALTHAEPALIGPAVGNADLLIADGNRLYNEKQYEKARDNFLKASRITPSNVNVYLSLARAYLATKQVEFSCPAYKTYVKNASDGPDRQKAQGELELCERQLKAKLPAGSPLGQKYVTQKAALFDALDKGNLVGPKSAAEELKGLIDAQYAAPDLGDMAGKVSATALSRAEAIYKASTTHQKVPGDELRRAAALYNLALDTGSPPTTQLARASFVEGMALLLEGKAFQAETLFADAIKRDPTDTESKFYRGFAIYRTGDKQGAVRGLEADLPNDPRTGILKVAMAFDKSPEAAALDFEKFVFARRFKSVP